MCAMLTHGSKKRSNPNKVNSSTTGDEFKNLI